MDTIKEEDQPSKAFAITKETTAKETKDTSNPKIQKKPAISIPKPLVSKTIS